MISVGLCHGKTHNERSEVVCTLVGLQSRLEAALLGRNASMLRGHQSRDRAVSPWK